MVKKLKKQKHILLSRRQLLRNIVFCLNKATLPGIVPHHWFYINCNQLFPSWNILSKSWHAFINQVLVRGKRNRTKFYVEISNLQEYMFIGKFNR